MKTTRRRVVKVGGSLLSWVELTTSLQIWLDRQTPAQNVLLAGGGPFVDLVREADSCHGLGEAASHWICIDLLHATARLLASLLPAAALLRRWVTLIGALKTLSEQKLLILDPVQFLQEVEPQLAGANLPATWAATSDSIAARVAEALQADELVLLKSALPQSADTVEAIAEMSFVDQFFPRASKNLKAVRVVNLRSPSFDEVLLHCAQ